MSRIAGPEPRAPDLADMVIYSDPIGSIEMPSIARIDRSWLLRTPWMMSLLYELGEMEGRRSTKLGTPRKSLKSRAEEGSGHLGA